MRLEALGKLKNSIISSALEPGTLVLYTLIKENQLREVCVKNKLKQKFVSSKPTANTE
jgi:hypothetical protein